MKILQLSKYIKELQRGSVSMTSLKPFACFYGGKWRAAPRYPRPEHNRIVEPFAGLAGYSTRYPDKEVILVEKDPQIAALWRWLISVSVDEVLSLPLEIVDTQMLTCCAEAKSLIGFWLNKGAAVPCRTPSAWMRSGINPKSFWGREVRQRIADQVSHIRHWVIVEGDYAQAPDIEATWFIDPPYQGAGKHYRESKIDYVALAAWCQARKGQVVVCENVGADWLPFEPFALIKANSGKTGGKYSAEAIWVRP